MAKVSAAVGAPDKHKNQPRKRPGRHSKRVKRRDVKQSFFGKS